MLELAEATDVWRALPAEIAGTLRMEASLSITEMIEAVSAAAAAGYYPPLDTSYTGALSRAVRHAVDTFVERVADPEAPLTAIVDEFRGLGFAAGRDGRSLEPLQAAMRLSARVGWRRLCAVAGDQGLDMLMLGRIGEAIFVYLDELAAASACGYRDAHAELAGERDRNRRKLLDMILADPPPAAEALAGIANAAGWTPPRRVAVVALGERPAGESAVSPELPPGALIDWARREPCVLVPDPDGPGRVTRLTHALRGWDAAMGPVVPLARAGMSLRWARMALGLTARGIIDSHGRLVRCDEHLSTLLIFSDEELAGALRAAQLAPLLRLRPAQQDRLAETLLAWLQHGCNANEVAASVHVHPQTVRYRLRQVDELFGDQLRDPDRCSYVPSRGSQICFPASILGFGMVFWRGWLGLRTRQGRAAPGGGQALMGSRPAGQMARGRPADRSQASRDAAAD